MARHGGWEQSHEEHFPKPYSSSPCARLQARGLQRFALPIVGARRGSGWRGYGGGAVARRGKTLVRLDVFWHWSIGCLYRLVQQNLVVHRDLNRLRLLSANLKPKKSKNKSAKKRRCPRKMRRFKTSICRLKGQILADHSRIQQTIHAGALCPAWSDETRRGETSTCM
jgi:hypothetical protein